MQFHLFVGSTTKPECLYLILTITPKSSSQQLTELSRTPLPSLSYSLKATKKRGEMKVDVLLDQVITQMISGQELRQSTHTPACPLAGHPPAERSNMKHPSERPPLQERRRRQKVGCEYSGYNICTNSTAQPCGDK